MMSCSLFIKSHEKSMNETDCKNIAKIRKFLSKNIQLGKCFTLLNVNQMNYSFKNFKMNESSRIELYFLPQMFENWTTIFIRNDKFLTNLIHMSLHSSRSILTRKQFYAIDITKSNDRVYNFEFSKIITKSLEWPHETNCESIEIESNLENGVNYVYEDCVNSCIFDQMYAKNKCVQIKGNVEIDLILDKKTEDLNICDENITRIFDSQKIEMYCLRICHQNCINEYIQIQFEKIKKFGNKTIEIKSANFPIMEYESISRVSIFNYASNLGAIFSIWFGVAVVDLHKFFEQLMIIIYNLIIKLNSILEFQKLLQITFIYRIINSLVKIIRYISSLILKVKKLNFKLFFKIICLTCFVYQFIQMTSEYLKYKTVVFVRKELEIMNGSVDSFPAISFCKSIDLQTAIKTITLESNDGGKDIERLIKKCDNSNETNSKQIKCKISNSHYFEVLNNQSLLSDYLNVIDLKFDGLYGDRGWHNANKLKSLGHSFGVITSHSNGLKCYTFNSQLSESSNSSFNMSQHFFDFLEAKGYLYIHDRSLLPLFLKSHMNSKIYFDVYSRFYYDKKYFKLLPAPYETNCFDYKGSKFNSQPECINEFLFEKFLMKNKCLPKNDEKIAYVIKNYNYSKFEKNICKNTTYFSDQISYANCRKPCDQILYEVWSLNFDYRQNFTQKMKQYFIVIEHKPELKFDQFLMNLGGLIGFWHGLSIIDLKNLLMKFFKKIIMKSSKLQKLRSYFVLFKFFKKIKTSKLMVDFFQ